MVNLLPFCVLQFAITHVAPNVERVINERPMKLTHEQHVLKFNMCEDGRDLKQTIAFGFGSIKSLHESLEFLFQPSISISTFTW